MAQRMIELVLVLAITLAGGLAALYALERQLEAQAIIERI